MGVRIFLSTTLRSNVDGYNAADGLILDPAEGETVRSACVRLGIPVENIKMVMVNGRSASMDHPIKDGDRLGLFPPVGGG